MRVLEPCQSGLTYLFAKEAGCKSPREFESRRLRQENSMEKQPLISTQNKPSGIEKSQETQNPLINYIEVIIDDEYVQKNLLPGNGLRMKSGHANWNGEVDLIRYVMSENLSPEYQEMVKDKIEKLHARQEKTYQHEAHHIRNRENNLTPHVAASNLREFLAFRVLDEMSAFLTGEIFNKKFRLRMS